MPLHNVCISLATKCKLVSSAINTIAKAENYMPKGFIDLYMIHCIINIQARCQTYKLAAIVS